jgi:hypothetical protein
MVSLLPWVLKVKGHLEALQVQVESTGWHPDVAAAPVEVNVLQGIVVLPLGY